MVFLSNAMCARFSRQAHKGYGVLHSFMAQYRITRYESLKVQAFVERLSTGPHIGFYCLDVFPMNDYEFYQYLTIVAKNYFLLLEFMSIF